jgi:hypothetical protein
MMELPVVPRSPVITVGPVLVIAEAAKAPYVDAVPKSINVYKLLSDFKPTNSPC